MKCIVKHGVFGRWYLAHPLLAYLAWSGSRWVATIDGIPAGGVQISNFATEDEAYRYALESGFTTVAVSFEQ